MACIVVIAVVSIIAAAKLDMFELEIIQFNVVRCGDWVIDEFMFGVLANIIKFDESGREIALFYVTALIL